MYHCAHNWALLGVDSLIRLTLLYVIYVLQCIDFSDFYILDLIEFHIVKCNCIFLLDFNSTSRWQNNIMCGVVKSKCAVENWKSYHRTSRVKLVYVQNYILDSKWSKCNISLYFRLLSMCNPTFWKVFPEFNIFTSIFVIFKDIKHIMIFVPTYLHVYT